MKKIIPSENRLNYINKNIDKFYYRIDDIIEHFDDEEKFIKKYENVIIILSKYIIENNFKENKEISYKQHIIISYVCYELNKLFVENHYIDSGVCNEKIYDTNTYSYKYHHKYKIDKIINIHDFISPINIECNEELIHIIYKNICEKYEVNIFKKIKDENYILGFYKTISIIYNFDFHNKQSKINIKQLKNNLHIIIFILLFFKNSNVYYSDTESSYSDSD